jgi:hypothetical protein
LAEETKIVQLGHEKGIISYQIQFKELLAKEKNKQIMFESLLGCHIILASPFFNSKLISSRGSTLKVTTTFLMLGYTVEIYL